MHRPALFQYPTLTLKYDGTKIIVPFLIYLKEFKLLLVGSLYVFIILSLVYLFTQVFRIYLFYYAFIYFFIDYYLFYLLFYVYYYYVFIYSPNMDLVLIHYGLHTLFWTDLYLPLHYSHLVLCYPVMEHWNADRWMNGLSRT